MRGKPAAAPRKLRNTRITPADAGKTLTAPHKGLSGLDHPRRCGENLISYTSISTLLGSPPQVRGKPSFSVVLGLPIRITPAGAGKTSVLGCDTNF